MNQLFTKTIEFNCARLLPGRSRYENVAVSFQKHQFIPKMDARACIHIDEVEHAILTYNNS
jgi:hypothetical protein